MTRGLPSIVATGLPFLARAYVMRARLALTTVRAPREIWVWRPRCPTVSEDPRSIGLPHAASGRYSDTSFDIQGLVALVTEERSCQNAESCDRPFPSNNVAVCVTGCSPRQRMLPLPKSS